MVVIEPAILFETFVYHSGKKRYTAVINNRIGMQNKAAMGNPLINLAGMLLYLSLSFSQYFINCVSFSLSMAQN